MELMTAKPLLARLALGLSLGAGLFGIGYHVGAKKAEPLHKLEELARLPVAKGFLDLPGTYQLDVRSTSQNEREVYLRNAVSGLEVRIPDAAERLFRSYAGNGSYVLEGAMRTVEGARWVGGRLGANTELPRRYGPE